jgi:hypothetical protein
MSDARELDHLYDDLAEIEAEALALTAEIDALDVEHPTLAQVDRLDWAMDRLDDLDARGAQVRRDIGDIEEGAGLRDYLADCTDYRSVVR